MSRVRGFAVRQHRLSSVPQGLRSLRRAESKTTPGSKNNISSPVIQSLFRTALQDLLRSYPWPPAPLKKESDYTGGRQLYYRHGNAAAVRLAAGVASGWKPVRAETACWLCAEHDSRIPKG